MNELDLIRSFRADVAPPDGEAVARAERAWRRTRSRRSRGRSPRRSSWSSPLVAAGVAATAAVAVAVALPGGDDGRLGPAEATAAGTLRLAAEAQGGELPRPLRAGEFWYVRTRSASIMSSDEPDGYTAIQPAVREDWVARDGARRWMVRATGPISFPGPRDRARWEAAGRPPVLGEGTEEHRAEAPRKGPFYLGDEPMTYTELLALPRDAASLYARLRQAAVECGCGHNVDSETFVIVADMLRHTPIPDDLRAAFLRAAALIPGIKLVNRDRDVAGRPGVAVAFDYARHRDELLFDRESFRRLGENDRLLARDDGVDAAPGQLIGGWAYVDSGIVRSPFTRP